MLLRLPLSELLEHNAVGEALPADADPFQDAVTSQLIQNQMRLHLTSLKEALIISRIFPAAGLKEPM